MFHESFGAQKTMITFISKFDPRKSEFQVKFGQVSEFFFFNMPILSSIVSEFQNVIHFNVHQLEMPKVAFRKMTSSPLLVFFYHCTVKYKDISLKFGISVICMQL